MDGSPPFSKSKTLSLGFNILNLYNNQAIFSCPPGLGASGPVHLLDPFPKPPGFLVKHVDEDQRRYGNGDDRVEDRQDNDINEDPLFNGHGSAP
jgi:hypothetical protein